ncbi:RHS repeat-associated core domain-containing protein [Chitinophaga filiformis]|uniref:RHS repeat domain-containing protein n=1 Tax=Chitinophaga filiformis TaxID=104663 RepID=UPI001F254E3B|nr:RHS repeat-associated core domain-containing protein [Chitinophaga filiformis]MCF6405192.1 RHS repeat-associated core domain-containing protein [Chitinophaga filiformis]
MHSLPKKRALWLTALILLIAVGSSFAQTGSGRTLRNILDGSKGQLARDSAATVQDSLYFNPALISKLDTPYQVKNIVTFKVNEYSNAYLPAKFSIILNTWVIYTRPDFAIDSVNKLFTINYDAAGTYTSRSSFVFGNAHKVTVKVSTVSISGAPITVLKALVLENEMQVYPVYKLSCTDDAVKSISAASAPDTDSTDELTVSWPVTAGADVYDLEWAYVDSSAYVNNKYGNPVNATLLFRNNASRVTVADNTYRIPLLYDNGGILFFRVRAVQQKSNVSRIETAWSSDYTGGLGRYSFTGHQRKLNWQMSVSYAEEGKRKAVVQYYDGSLRNRQVVTKDNTTNKTTVAETFYDYQGRPAIQVMPAPSINSVIKYAPRFNSALNGAEYDKSNYDKLNAPSEYLTARANQMSSATGANQYYSANNPEKNNGVNQFIPDAGGFAFSETVYTPDNTGRTSRQSGFGPVYRIGSNHETRYYYATPGDNDLDVLFGTEAGDKSHYFKNMVQDANGQYAITYLDMYGRTVATALAGTADSASLDNLSSNTTFPVTDTLSRVNSNVIKDLVMENTQSQLVAIDGDYQFKYSLAPPVLQKKDCNNNTVCYTALYDLQIKITDDAYNQRLGGKPFDTIIRNYTGTIVPDCNAPQALQVAFTLRLPRGNYQITKRLTVNREAMAYYRDSVFMKRNFCTTLEQFIQQQRDFQANTQCIPNCAACQDSIGTWDNFRTRYMTAGGIAIADSAAYRGEAQAAYAEAVAACEVLCEKTTESTDVKAALLLDVSAPSGQYADAEDTLNVYSIFYQPDENTLPPYKRDTVTYLDEAGRPDLAYDELSNTYVIPQRLRPEQFAAQFKASWAPALLKFHPEYCKWLEFQKHQASYVWDREFEKTDTYAEAKAKGYLNPTGNGSYPYPIVTANRDPLSLESTEMLNALQAKLSNYNGGSGSQILTMWSTATATVKCEGNNASCITSYAPASAPFNETALCTGDLDMAWRNFRQLYLSAKRAIIDNKIKTAACPSGVSNPTSAALLAAGKQLNFNNATDALGQNGLGYLNNGQSGPASDSANNAVKRHYEDNCNAYAKAWVQQLAPCKYTQAMLNILIPRLVEVCKEGSDVSHPMGSSSVRPGSTYAYKSFQQVLEEFNAQQGISNGVDCNGYLITAPAPYDKQTAFGNKPVYSKPDTCECRKLNNLRAEYLQYGKPTDGSFAGYLNRTRQINMSDADLTQLLNACNTTSSCTYFTKIISLPPALQCYTGEICVPCNVVNNAYTRFTAKFPGITPTIEEGDTTQQKRNTLFANYMNNELGFKKQAWEYLKFRADCPVAPPPTAICTTITNIRNNFLNLYPVTLGDSITVNRTAPTLRITHLLSTRTTAYASSVTLGASVWTNNGVWFTFRDNIVFNFARIAKGANITYADMNLFAKPASAGGELVCGSLSHYAANPGTISLLFSRSLGPVVANVTTWAGQPGTVAANTLTIPPITSTQSSANYLNQVCTNLVRDMYTASRSGTDYGLIMRLSSEPATTRNGFVFWSNSTTNANAIPPFLNVRYRAHRCNEFEVYFNENYGQGTNYTITQIDSFYQANCGNVSGVCGSTPPTTPTPVYDGPLLCGKSTPVFPPADVNTINNCSDTAFFAVSKGTELYNAYRDSLLGSFGQDYINTGLLAANREVFTVSYNTSEYHYTLFYYDQAGNLVKTVPPAGVVIDRSAAWVNSVKAARAAGQVRVPAHKKITQYRYNTLDQVVEQQTPDGGITRLWYDKLGRPVLTQDAQQRVARDYSYTFYDGLGRITEVGQLSSNTIVNDNLTRNPSTLQHFYSSARATCIQINRTTYDIPYAPLSQLVLSARNVRNRVAWKAVYKNSPDLGAGRYTSASFYSYDIHGNVDTLLQDYKEGGMADAGNRFKKIVYKYDLISGNVKQVAYQPSQADAFYHRYTYDAENRLINVETSRDSVYWENDAYYQYYRHGLLARTVLGQQQVQGLDYAYTLNGWIKGVNATTLTGNADMGKDGISGSVVGRDAFGYSLYYYGAREYKPINSTVTPFAPVEGTGFKPVFTGTISAISQHIASGNVPLLALYSYDALTRLKSTQFARGLNTSTNTWTPVTVQDFKENITYDEDGNILSYTRNGNNSFAGRPLAMDNLTYNYKPWKNQLDFVADTVNAANYDNDIDNQVAGNYSYDSTGSLIKDVAAGISNITWTRTGKIASITKTDGTVTTFTYDIADNRISKTVNGVQTWYVRDGAGKVMSVYTKGNNVVNSGSLTRTEAHLYGAARLGISAQQTDVQNVVQPETVALRGLGTGINRNFIRGNKFFELSNHLGNVLATVSDKKKMLSTDSTTISYFEPDVVSTQEYYAFGMAMPGRGGNSNKYRYGFNGKENDNEIKGDGNQQDYGFRIYDPRLGRFLSTDPLTKSYPWYTPYQFAGNRPVNSIDLDGLEEFSSYESYKNSFGDKAMAEDKWDGSDGAWLASDRENDVTGRWSKAMEAITANGWTDRFKSDDTQYPFPIVRDYYHWAQRKMDEKGYKSRWAKGAAYLVDELADSYNKGITSGSATSGWWNELGPILKDLNLGIAAFAVGQFHDVFYNCSMDGKTSFMAWYCWDYDFIMKEQVTVVAYDVYKKYEGSTSLDYLNALARKEGFTGTMASWGASIGAGHYFPSFATFNIDLEDPKTEFGAMGRFHLPMLMLWNTLHSNQEYPMTKEQAAEVKKAYDGINEYYEQNIKKK